MVTKKERNVTLMFQKMFYETSQTYGKIKKIIHLDSHHQS